jgi:hypothetical protein
VIFKPKFFISISLVDLTTILQTGMFQHLTIACPQNHFLLRFRNTQDNENLMANMHAFLTGNSIALLRAAYVLELATPGFLLNTPPWLQDHFLRLFQFVRFLERMQRFYFRLDGNIIGKKIM